VNPDKAQPMSKRSKPCTGRILIMTPWTTQPSQQKAMLYINECSQQ